jgi:hypothetical protein
MDEMRLLRTSKGLAAAAVMAAVVLVAGIAFAVWQAAGTGQGYAKAGSAQNLTTLDGSGSVSTSLIPGGSGDFVIKVSNPNAYAVSLTGATLGGSVSATGGLGTCSTTGVTVSQGAIDATLPHTVPANGTWTDVVSSAASMDNTSQNGCQGATFTQSATLGGVSA